MPGNILLSLLSIALIAAFSADCDKNQESIPSGPARPEIRKLGTIDCDMVEATPIVFNGKLYRFEYVRSDYKANTTGDTYFRFIDVETGETTPAFAKGYHLGSAFVAEGTVYVYGVALWGKPTIEVFWSNDLINWKSQTALTTEGWGIYNNSVCLAGDRYIMAFEVGEPPEIAGVRFTAYFAESSDLLNWKLLQPDRVYTKERYSACPAIRFLDGYFYMFYLEAKAGPEYETYLVRSKNLKEWESSPMNPVLKHSPEDKIIANTELTDAEKERIRNAEDRNNSDFDFCEFDGKVVIYYSWGNQLGVEHLAEAEYSGSMADFLHGFFPESSSP